MTVTNDFSELRKQLPHGAIKTISDRININYSIVLRVMNGDTRSPQTPEVIKAAAEYLKEFKAKESEAVKALNEVLNN